eukprot:5767913-Pyramimonas_sp.AAC.1
MLPSRGARGRLRPSWSVLGASGAIENASSETPGERLGGVSRPSGAAGTCCLKAPRGHLRPPKSGPGPQSPHLWSMPSAVGPRARCAVLCM